MTNVERVLDFLQSIYPQAVTNATIVARTRITPHTQVFQITRRLMSEGRIEGRVYGKEWEFWASGVPNEPETGTLKRGIATSTPLAAIAFEGRAREVMTRHFGAELTPARLPGVPKTFDLVSRDHAIVGDATFFTLVAGERLPPAKFSIIAEHVWLLEHVICHTRFLVFGNDRRVPETWIKKYGHLVGSVEFYFLSDNELPERLKL